MKRLIFLKIFSLQVSSILAELTIKYDNKQTTNDEMLSGALILHDIGTKEERKNQVDDFKAGKIDFLFVYNMLLTGFDAKRLKKLYMGRVIKKHNLLQALTRVNRTYKDFKYGYVVDFADISKEFDATNKAYFDELQSELGDEMEHYSNLFKSKEELERLFKQKKLSEVSQEDMNANISSLNKIYEKIKELNRQNNLLNEHKMLAGVVSMPSNIFATTGTNVSIIFIDKTNSDKVVLIDASKLGTAIKDGKNQKTVLSDEEEKQIIDTFNKKEAIDDFSVVLEYDEIKEKNYSFSAGQYFDVKIEYVDITKEEFDNKMRGFQEDLQKMFSESKELEDEILANFKKLDFE